MSERAWYQDGFVVLAIIVVVVLFGPPIYKAFQQEQLGGFSPKFSGQVSRPIFGSSEFIVEIYHQNPGDLQNGAMTITIRSELLEDSSGQESKTYSFESWSPNEENATKLRYPLARFDMSTEIVVEIKCSARNIRDYKSTDTWLGEGWVSNQD